MVEQVARAYQWPETAKPVAPDPVPGRLVTWSEFVGSGKVAGGIIAWMGGIRIGRVDVLEDGRGQWFFGLPLDGDDEEENPYAPTGYALVERCKEKIEAAATAWVKAAGLTN